MSLTHDAWRAGRCLALALLLMVLPGRTVQAQGADGTDRPTGVSHYDAYLEPEPAARTLKGLVLLTVTPRALAAGTLTLDRGDLTIDRVEAGGRALRFELAPRTVQIPLPGVSTRPSTISVRYHGAPRAGLLFFPERRIIYTIFSTSHWMVAEDAPASRATFRLRVVVPRGWTVVGNGRERSRRALSAQADLSEWLQDRAVPTYTFGFVAGELTRVARRANGAALEYVGQGMSPQALDGVFGETARMIDFFRSRAGVDLPGGRYAQVVVPETIGQEMAGFAVVSADYARGVLADPTTNTLLAHELAHQWWGNMVTCRAWTHFWLNEGFATFMSAAYREQRFGRAVYLQDVEQMRSRYERVRAAGRDRALVFPEWSHPTADDRTIVYQKGAYVLHRLREALGETPFWAGVALYTRRHMGRSVTTDDFRRAMEEASRRDLAAFFAEWVDLRR